MMSIQDKLDAIRDEFETKLAPHIVVDAMRRSIKELIAGGMPQKALKAGDTAPTFTLAGADEKPVSSFKLLSKGPLVLSFFRGIWCPYCNADLQTLEAARAGIEARGATLVAISQQVVLNNRKSKLDNQLGFSVLSDRGGRVAEAFGVRWKVPEYLQLIHTELGADISEFNGEASWTLPLPARYVIDQYGIIAFAYIDADHAQRSDPSDIFPILDQLNRTKNRPG